MADLYLPTALQSLGATVVSVASSLLVVCASAPAIVLPLLPATWCCRAAQRLYAASARELKRLEARANPSPCPNPNPNPNHSPNPNPNPNPDQVFLRDC